MRTALGLVLDPLNKVIGRIWSIAIDFDLFIICITSFNSWHINNPFNIPSAVFVLG